MFNHFFTKIS